MTSVTPTDAAADVAVVGACFEAFAHGDLDAFAAAFHEDATWNHRNDDRLGGLHQGRDGIVAFIAESGALSAGTLRAEPQAIMADGQGRVAVLVRVRGSRTDGRSFDDTQVLLLAVEDGRLRSADQFVGDPAAVAAFWA
jgi:ketosteroid isomerase-like protein